MAVKKTIAPKGRTLAEFGKLRSCEKVLLEACREGEVAEFNNGKRPEKKPQDDACLRAEFVRFLYLGGDADAPVHESGVAIIGGWIDSELDLDSCSLPFDLKIWDSTVDGDVSLMGAMCRTIALNGTRVKGIMGDRLVAKGDVFLRDGFASEGEVSLLGARIGGCLACIGGQFKNPDGDALSCDGMSVSGGVFLRGGFHAQGAVRLLGARISGNLECDGGKFINPNGDALSCDGATVSGGFIFRELSALSGAVSLPNMHVGALIDDAEAWALGHNHILDGFRYDAIASGPTDAATRIIWLKTQREKFLTTDFHPQPWQQLIRVLRRMGHEAEADEVAIAFQEQRRIAGRVQGGWIGRGLHRLFGWMTGYGLKPLRLLYTMIAVWVACGVFYKYAATNGAFGPSNPLVFNHPDYAHCRPDAELLSEKGKQKVGNWYWCQQLPGEYTAFQPFLYSLDLILPLVELQQDKDWAAIVPSPPQIFPDMSGPEVATISRQDMATWTIGEVARVVMWLEIMFGWIASLLFVAILTGLTDHKNES